MKLTALQAELLKHLRSAVEAKPSRRVVYYSEWLGYLPFGLYHWVEADGQDISLSLPWGWGREDLGSLENAGFIVRIDEWKNPTDESELAIAYEVAVAESPTPPDQPRD